MGIETESDNSLENSNDYESDTEEINTLFLPCEHIHGQYLGPKYILDISATRETNPFVAAALSDYSCIVFSLSGTRVAEIAQFSEHSNKLVNSRFCPDNNNLLYTSSTDGTIKLWDLRESKGSTCTFTSGTLDSVDEVKPLCSFDVSPCNRLLAAGTDLIDGDAYILFWDVRNIKPLGGYWESHTDDIIQVKFNPDDSNKLISGSTDGLINIYNLSESTEDDALQVCLNTETVIEELGWFNENKRWKISCVTSTHNLQLWEPDGAEPYKRFTRENISEKIKKTLEYTYVVKVLPIKNTLLLLSGSNEQEGKSLRSLKIANGALSPVYQFKQNTQIVRASWVNDQTNLLVTGGEKGILDLWKMDYEVLNFKEFKRK